ncbi:hypothetical protein BDZ97DRAFT_1373473 [Flammula alnicola]|nr:hypothetical protein BDZ97DRAFT_1373473 [Flammula alnicola]
MSTDFVLTIIQCRLAFYCSRDMGRRAAFLFVFSRSCCLLFSDRKRIGKSRNRRAKRLYYEIVLIALEFKLIDDPSLTTPFIARVDITIEPSDFKVLYKMPETKDKPEEMEGMLQTAAMTAPPYLPLNHTSQKMWIDARKEMDDSRASCRSCSVYESYGTANDLPDHYLAQQSRSRPTKEAFYHSCR